EAQRGEATGHATEHEGLAEAVGRVREVPDVVEHGVGRGRAVGPADAAAVRGDGDARLLAAPPERVVVVGAVESEEVDVGRAAGRGAPDGPGREHGAEPEPDRVV